MLSPVLLSLCRLVSYNLLNEVSSLFWHFEVSVRYRRKKFTFAISSPDEFLFPFIFAVLLPVLSRLLKMFIYTRSTFFDFSRWRPSAILEFEILNCWSGSECQHASSCQISRRLVELLPRYGHFYIFKMAAVRHL